MPHARGALKRLREKGYKLLVVTNQPDVSRGVSSKESVRAINEKLAAQLDLDEILVCYHSDDDHCECRKPKPGLLLDAARRHQINLAESFMVGDRWRDVEAGQKAGCRTILIDAGYDERDPGQPPTVRVHSLQEAADWILEVNSMGVAR